MRMHSATSTRIRVPLIAFLPLCFLLFGYFDPAVQDLLDRVYHRYRLSARVREWDAHALIHRRLSFAIMRMVDQFGGFYLLSFG